MITGYSIEQVLPHRPPMILLDNFIEAGADYAICTLTITEQSPFYDAASQTVPAYVGIEYMAQTIAAYAGASNLAKGGAVKIGFLLGSRKYQPTVTVFKAGSTLEISAQKLVMEKDQQQLPALTQKHSFKIHCCIKKCLDLGHSIHFLWKV